VVKMFALIPARTDRSLAHFHEHWRTRHRELALGLDSMRRYVQCHRLAGVLNDTPEELIEGIALVWFDDVRAALALVEDPVFRERIGPDEPNFMDVARRRFLFTEEEDVLVGVAGEVKVTVLVRGAGERPGDWAAAQRAAVGAAFGGATRATWSRAIREANDPAIDITAVFEVWATGVEALRETWSAGWERYLAHAGDGVDAASCRAFASDDLWVIGPDQGS
jgi:uncharacterized protein (TIGR02118 family)